MILSLRCAKGVHVTDTLFNSSCEIAEARPTFVNYCLSDISGKITAKMDLVSSFHLEYKRVHGSSNAFVTVVSE